MVFAPFVTSYTTEPTRCASGVRPGARALQDWACDESPWGADLWDVGIFACRDTLGGWCPRCRYDRLSSHASGGAGDSACNVFAVPGGNPSAAAFALWLVEHHAVLGVQEVIWDRRRWTNQTLEWRAYNGRSPHVDHVHWALNESGRRALTRDRILSVAPQEDPMPALTDAEQRKLLANTEALLVIAAETKAVVLRGSMAVVRRQGTGGMNTVSLAWGGFRAPLASQEAANVFKFVLGQRTAAGLPPVMFDALTDVADVATLVALINT